MEANGGTEILRPSSIFNREYLLLDEYLVDLDSNVFLLRPRSVVCLCVMLSPITKNDTSQAWLNATFNRRTDLCFLPTTNNDPSSFVVLPMDGSFYAYSCTPSTPLRLKSAKVLVDGTIRASHSTAGRNYDALITTFYTRVCCETQAPRTL